MRPSGEAYPAISGPFQTERKSSVRRLLLIPILLYAVWVLETYLLEGSVGLFWQPQPLPFLLYTVFANGIVGTILPVMCLRSAFMSGAVNMFQAGFRSLRRTVLASGLTALSGYLYLATFTPSGTHAVALFNTFMFIVPAAVAQVMICWVLIGTHVQAYLRKGRTAVSITLGVVVTAVLFGFSFAAHSPPLNQPDLLLLLSAIGAGAALFFFAVRDVYASVIFVACSTMPVVLQGIDPVFTSEFIVSVYGAAALSLVCLTGCHLYLLRNFRTIRVPA